MGLLLALLPLWPPTGRRPSRAAPAEAKRERAAKAAPQARARGRRPPRPRAAATPAHGAQAGAGRRPRPATARRLAGLVLIAVGAGRWPLSASYGDLAGPAGRAIGRRGPARSSDAPACWAPPLLLAAARRAVLAVAGETPAERRSARWPSASPLAVRGRLRPGPPGGRRAPLDGARPRRVLPGAGGLRRRRPSAARCGPCWPAPGAGASCCSPSLGARRSSCSPAPRCAPRGEPRPPAPPAGCVAAGVGAGRLVAGGAHAGRPGRRPRRAPPTSTEPPAVRRPGRRPRAPAPTRAPSRRARACAARGPARRRRTPSRPSSSPSTSARPADAGAWKLPPLSLLNRGEAQEVDRGLVEAEGRTPRARAGRPRRGDPPGRHDRRPHRHPLRARARARA